jgi:hypothetical protein
MKYYNLNESLDIVFLGDYSSIQDADSHNDDSEQIVIVDFEDLFLWKEDIQKIEEEDKNENFIFELASNLMFKMVTPFPNDNQDMDNALASTESIWILSGTESLLKLKSQINKFIQDF